METPLPPLAHVHATILHVAPRLLALPHVLHSLSELLDVSSRFSLATAASTRSVPLVDRVVQRLTHTHGLSSPLMSHWYARAMDVALKNDDLLMIQKIHDLHAAPLVLDALKLAMQCGSLETVQWVVEHRHDRLCCAPGVKNLCTQCAFKAVRQLGEQDSLRVVQWLLEEGFPLTLANHGPMASPLYPAVVKSMDLLRWLDEHGFMSIESAEYLFSAAISTKTANNIAIVQYLITQGYSMTQETMIDALHRGSCQPQNESVVEFVVSSRLCESLRADLKYEPTRPGGAKVLQWTQAFVDSTGNDSFARNMSYNAIVSGHIDTIQWLMEQELLQGNQANSALPWLSSEEYVMGSITTMETLGLGHWTTQDVNVAAASGYLEVVQHLLSLDGVVPTTRAMDVAAANGHLHVVRWLHGSRTEGCTSRAMDLAAAHGHLGVVQWLCENRSEHNATAAMACAASDGHLEVLMWLYENQDDGCASCATDALVVGVAVVSERYNGALNCLQWLREQPARMGCQGNCDGSRGVSVSLALYAVQAGDLHLLQYLTRYYPGTPHPGPHSIAHFLGCCGHLPLVQWFYTYLHDMADWNEVCRAAQGPLSNHPHVVAWLDAQ